MPEVPGVANQIVQGDYLCPLRFEFIEDFGHPGFHKYPLYPPEYGRVFSCQELLESLTVNIMGFNFHDPFFADHNCLVMGKCERM